MSTLAASGSLTWRIEGKFVFSFEPTQSPINAYLFPCLLVVVVRTHRKSSSTEKNGQSGFFLQLFVSSRSGVAVTSI
jgi:hypothetical protein